jgi:AAA15 family ATPase/GTPase
MLHGFSVSNYKSFKDLVTFNLSASPIIEEIEALNENNMFRVDRDLCLLKSAALYGANASGKSNFLSAIDFMKCFVLNSAKKKQLDTIEIEPFGLVEPQDESSFFEIVFFLEGNTFRYGFQLDCRAVTSEWLFRSDSNYVEEEMVFEGVFNTYLLDNFPEGQNNLISKRNKNALLLSVAAQAGGELSCKILSWFENLQIVLDWQDVLHSKKFLELFSNPENKKIAIGMIKKLDLGISDILVNPEMLSIPASFYSEESTSLQAAEPTNTGVYTAHRKYGASGETVSIELFDIEKYESEGTIKLLVLTVFIVEALRTQKILLIDELDTRLHPLVIHEIIRLFNSNETNSKNAQLVFATHDVSLLSINTLRKDQIWFTEKNLQGVTELYSLVEYRVRKSSSPQRLERDYLIGRYGGIPSL